MIFTRSPSSLGVRAVKVLVLALPIHDQKVTMVQPARTSFIVRTGPRLPAEKRRISNADRDDKLGLPLLPEQRKPHHRDANVRTTPHHRSDSGSRTSATPPPHNRERRGARRPSTGHREAPKSVLRSVAQRLPAVHTHMNSGSAELPPKLCGKCPDYPVN